MFEEFVSTYGTQLIYLIVSAIISFFGVVFKNIFQKFVNDKIKRSVAETCVKAVEQIYANLDGPAKLERCIGYMTNMLSEKGITVSELEIRMLIEAAVKELKLYFNVPEIGIEEKAPEVDTE